MVEAKGCTVELEPAYTNINITGSAVMALVSGNTTALGTGEIAAGELAASSVATSELAAAAVTAPKQAFVGAGSPPGGGRNVQGGTNVLSSGSRWISFGKKYEAAPYVVTTPLEEAVNAGGIAVSATSIVAGSFLAAGSGTSTGSFTWMALGSGSW